MAPLNIMSLNVQGLNNPNKRTKAFRNFASLKAHILCLQETHFTLQSTPKYFSPKYPQIFTASASTKQRGVLVAFHRSTPFTLVHEIKDPEGRYLILTGYLIDSAITIVSYYAPNKNPIPFLSHLFQVVDSHRMGAVMICGDSNQVIFPFLDKSPISSSSSPNKLSFSQLLAKHNMVDSWREVNPNKRRYTYYSHPHKTFSRIDHIFLTIGLIPETIASMVIPITWSDHNAVCTVIASTIPKAHDTTWCLNDSLLKNTSHCLDIKNALSEYLLHNSTPDVSPLTLWEAHKPVIRGICLRQAALFRRERKTLSQKLETNFNTCYTVYQNNPTSSNKTNLDKARLEFDLFLTESADKTLRRSRHNFYIKANKPDSPMARMLASLHKPFKPIRLKISRDTFSSNPIKILKKFKTHLATLYSSENNLNFSAAN